MVVVGDAAVEEVAVAAVDLAVTIDRSVGSAKKRGQISQTLRFE